MSAEEWKGGWWCRLHDDEPDILKKLKFRCLEFKNGQVITDDNL
jgi:hypothetical protein